MSQRMLFLLMVLPALLTPATSKAQESPKKAESERIKLWKGQAPIGANRFEPGEAWITLHRPAKGNQTAIIICPGGGYGGLVTGPEGHGIAAWLNRHGITGVVLEYRLPKGRPYVPLLDAQRAIRTVRKNAPAWGIDPARVGIMGFSAGGHLASTAGTHFDDGNPQANDPLDRISCRPDFMILIYPVITMGANTHVGSRNNLLGKDPHQKLLELFSNEKHVTARTPPAFLAHARDDKPVPPRQQQGIPGRASGAPCAGEVPGIALRRPWSKRVQGADVGCLAKAVAGLAVRDEIHSNRRRGEIGCLGETSGCMQSGPDAYENQLAAQAGATDRLLPTRWSGHVAERGRGMPFGRTAKESMEMPAPANNLELCRLIVDQSPDAIIFADQQGVIQIWNRAASDLFGYPAEEAWGQSLDMIIPEHLRRAHWAGYNESMTSGNLKHKGHALKTRATHRNGEKLYIGVAFSIVRDQENRIIGALATARPWSPDPAG